LIPITPSNHRVLLWLPESLIAFLMKRMFGGETMPTMDRLLEHLPRTAVHKKAS